MNHPTTISQHPEPGALLIKFCGDTQAFRLPLSIPQEGQAWLRANIGHAKISMNETIHEVGHNLPPLGRDWFGIPMSRINEKNFQVGPPLAEAGHFEAECFFLPKNASDPICPQGFRCVINVEPADTCCGNIIYNAFIRQFGVLRSC